MSVRNPYRPWWTEIEWDAEAAEYVAEETSRAWNRTRAMSGEHRIRWAARHSCKRLHRKLAAGAERIAELERQLAARNEAAAIRRELGIEAQQQAELSAAQQENARMREALEDIGRMLHSDDCTVDDDDDGCDCSVGVARRALATADILDAEGGADGEA